MVGEEVGEGDGVKNFLSCAFYNKVYYVVVTSRSQDEVGHFCSKQCGLTIKEGFPGNVTMHEAAQARTQVNKTIPVVLPSSMPSLCASSGAVSAFVMLLLLRMMWDSLFKSAHVHRHADVAGDARGRSQPRPGPLARADAPLVERNPVPVLQRLQRWSP